MSKADRLTWEEFVPYAPDVPGEQVRIHHCRQGNQNDRLYIRRNNDGSIVGYCHHCGNRGYYGGGVRSGVQARRKRSSSGVYEGRALSLPRDFTTDSTTWNPRARAWVRRYGITDDELRNNSVGYSEYLGSVVFPVFDQEGTLLVYQYRPIVREVGERFQDTQPEVEGGGRKAPKYITRRQKDREGGVDLFVARPSWSAGSDHDERGVATRVILTEDVLSAIKVSRVPENVGAALMGSSLKEKQAVKASRLGRDAAVFLDNDNEEVRKNQRKARKLLEPMMRGSVRIIEQDKDPKDFSTRELKELFDE